MEPTASAATVKVDPDAKFQITLTAEQVILVLNVLNEAHFKGSQAANVARTIDAIQGPVLLAAHQGKRALNED